MNFEFTSNLLTASSLLICCAGSKFTSQKIKLITYQTISFLVLFTSLNLTEAFAQQGRNFQSVNENKTTKSELQKTTGTNGEVEQEWVSIYNGMGGLRSDEASDIAVDSFGNVYVTGISQGLSYDYDCATIKYDAHGEVQWINRYDGGYDDYAYKLALDDSGNVYITGYSESLNTDADYLTIKYSTDGVEKWVRKYNGPGNSFDRANDLALDEAGNVYVTGESNGLETYSDYATIKYTPEGIEQWVRRYNGPVNSYDEAISIALDISGNVLVTGKSIGINYYNNYATLKYNTEGSEIWVQRFSFFGNYSDIPYDIATDIWSNVIVTGTGSSLDSTSLTPDYLTIKYDSTGVLLWNSRYNGPGNDFDEARVLAVDDIGNIIITGWSIGEGGRNDFATIKYNPSGTEEWVSRFNGGFVYDLATDKSGNVYVTGISADSTIDYTTIKYASDGIEQWIIKYSSYGLNMATAIAIDKARNVYVTGILEVPGAIPTFDYGTVKYGQRIVPVDLTNFTASLIDNYILLNWQTATETNNSGFEVQKQIRIGHWAVCSWEKIGFVAGYGTTTEPKTYMFRDSDVSYGVYYYRLKQFDFDGTFEYFNIVEVSVGSLQEFSLEQNYPNPFNPITIIKYDIIKVLDVTVTVYDILGREIAVLVNEQQQPGSYEVKWDASNFSSGIYIYQLNTTDYVDTKKMILLK